MYDLFDSLVGGAAVQSVVARSIAPTSDRLARNDNFSATIAYADGSLCTLYDQPGDRLRGHWIYESPFAPGLREVLLAASREAGVPARDGGCYGHVDGPRFNTRAEIRSLALAGVTAVSQTAGPETVLAGEAEIPYGLVGYATDSFPGFYLESSGLPVAARVDSPEEAAALLAAHWELAGAGVVFFIANSFSKSMSLYGERAGALSVVCADAAEAELVLGQLKATVRRNYSSPPIHAGLIVAKVLTEPALRASWEADVAAMRERILAMRRSLHAVLAAKLPGRDFSYFLTQHGMFSYTGLSAPQVDRLREEYAVYLVRSGRMCVAGLNTRNVEATAVAMAAVLAD